MCGIVGYISLEDDLYAQAKRHFSDYALMLDTLRGADSTGIVKVSKEFDVRTMHTTMSGAEYVQTEDYDNFMRKHDAWAMIGHNRAATAGSVKLENAHPFTFGDVTMVHNGTLWNQGKTVPGYDSKLEVDSMQIAKALSECSEDPKEVAKLLERIDGSFALVWVDRRDDSVNICRNSSRPFHFGYNPSKNIMWFMSDGNHLNAITASLYKSPSKPDTLYSLDKHKILKFKKGSLVPEVTSFRPFVRPQQSTARSTTTGKHHGKALEKAAERWQQGSREAHLKMSQSSSGDSSTEGKARIGGIRRVIPANHQKLLTEWYDLSPDDVLRFVPEEWMELENKQCTVYGRFVHPKWGFCEWPMTLHDVPLVICTAYNEYDWAVKAKGVGQCMQDYKSADVLSCLGELYCYDWRMLEKDEQYQAEPEEEEENLDTGLVVGPDETLIERGKCMELLKDGCVQCSSAIDWEERQSTTIVNEGRNVLCPACARDWLKEA